MDDRYPCDIDWQKNMLIFMKIIGDQTDEWHPELWVSYGMTEKDAKIILDQYEIKYSNDTSTAQKV